MSYLYTVFNSSRKKMNIFAENENKAAEYAISMKHGKKVSSMDVREYDYSKHKIMEDNYLKLLGCRNAIGILKREPELKNEEREKDHIFDYDGCFVVYKIIS